MSNQKIKNQSESGNVLFLILIAVALFAALSYVVTQSTRSGGGSTEREKNILSSAQMTQYPTSLRTSIIRLVLGGVAIENIKFNAPGSFGASTNAEIFHPQGGGATYQAAPNELMTSGVQGTWYYNGNFDVPGVGVDGAGGNDVIAFLPGISSGVCGQVNEELGVTVGTCNATGDADVPDADSAVLAADISEQMDSGYTFPTGNQPDLQCDGGTAFTRQASGCFYDVAGDQFVFYSVLLER